MKLNCWEFKKCGREDGGVNSKELGACPATRALQVHGINDGTYGGRACWAVGGTLCGGEVQGTFAAKLGDCLKCEFYLKVKSEEAGKFVTSGEILKILYKD